MDLDISPYIGSVFPYLLLQNFTSNTPCGIDVSWEGIMSGQWNL